MMIKNTNKEPLVPFEDDDDEFEPLCRSDSDGHDHDHGFVLVRADSDSSSDESDDSSDEQDFDLLQMMEPQPQRIEVSSGAASSPLLPLLPVTTDPAQSPSKSRSKSRTRFSNSRYSSITALFALLALCLFAGTFHTSFFTLTQQPPSSLAQQLALHTAPESRSIYIPGLGFSGFWFTLGRLKAHTLSLEHLPSNNNNNTTDTTNTNYVCFSAGCLGAVATLHNFTMEEMACMAQASQAAWKAGLIHQYDVVEHFVDGLVYRNFSLPSTTKEGGCLSSLHHPQPPPPPSQHPEQSSSQLYSNLHILTTTTSSSSSSSLLPQAVMRSPTTLNELKELLLQTTWIPYVTGNGLAHNGHLDGGFSLWQHPIANCQKVVALPSPLRDASLWWNSLNVNLGVDQAYRLWKDGLEYGL